MRPRILTIIAALILIGISAPASASWLSNTLGLNAVVKQVSKTLNQVPAHGVVTPVPEMNPTSASHTDRPKLSIQPELQATFVDANDRNAIIKMIAAFDAAMSSTANLYEEIFLGVTLGSILFGLGASIAGFCKQSTLAGILSITATAILGIGSALPIAQNADFYRVLAAQSRVLHDDAQLDDSMTVSEYKSFRERLKTLILYEGEKFPSRSSTQEATQTLISRLQRVRFDLAPPGATELSPQ